MITRVELEKKRSGSVFDPKSQRYVTYRVNVRVGGRRYRQSGFTSQKKAEEFVDALRVKKAFRKAGLKTPVGKVRLEQLFRRRRELIANPAEKMRASRIFDYFTELHGNLEAGDVRSSHFQHFINARLKDGVKPETVNREINLLSAAFRRGEEMFPDELEDFEPPRVPRPRFKRKRRERILTDDEKDKILAVLYRDREDRETDAAYQNRLRIGRMFHIAYLLGMAYNEVAHLRRGDYDGETLRFTRAKTGNAVTFEWLPPEARDVLEMAIAASETDHIFTISGSTPKGFYSILKRAITDAGLPYGRDHGITFHTTRHSFVTSAMQHGDLKTVGSMSGHSDDSMVLLYSHASPASRKKVLQAMYDRRDWREIYDSVRKGKMSFEEFEKLVR